MFKIGDVVSIKPQFTNGRSRNLTFRVEETREINIDGIYYHRKEIKIEDSWFAAHMFFKVELKPIKQRNLPNWW